jgi:hypothetical protein
MSKIEELRAGLNDRIQFAETRLETHRAEALKAEYDLAAALECLRVHDETVAALTNGVAVTVTAHPPNDAERQRRSLQQEIETLLTPKSYENANGTFTTGAAPEVSATRLAELIGNVRPVQVERALNKLKAKNKAWVDDGLWRGGPEPVPHVELPARGLLSEAADE